MWSFSNFAEGEGGRQKALDTGKWTGRHLEAGGGCKKERGSALVYFLIGSQHLFKYPGVVGFHSSCQNQSDDSLSSYFLHLEREAVISKIVIAFFWFLFCFVCEGDILGGELTLQMVWEQNQVGNNTLCAFREVVTHGPGTIKSHNCDLERLTNFPKIIHLEIDQKVWAYLLC